MTLLRCRNGTCLALLAVVAVATAAQSLSDLHDTTAASMASYAASQSMPIDPDVMFTAAEVYEAGQTYLDTDRYVKVILTPER